MKIQPITKYPFKGKEYNNLKEVQDAVHNIIGEEVIDKINRKIDIKHRDLFILLDILCSKEVRQVLTESLNVFVDIQDYEGESKRINILDYDNKRNN